GGWRSKFFVGKVMPGPIWSYLGGVGQRETLVNDQPYRISIDCLGNQIALYENDVRILTVNDESYAAGQWGLRTWLSKARFTAVELKASTPRCFVVMPFASQLDFVHRIIQKTVERFGMECIRADDLAISRPIIDDIKTQIGEADLVIVDFTGKNPNVYYE